ncbi:MAG: TssN family type VI secretion system protein [Ferruginibacter sp.]
MAIKFFLIYIGSFLVCSIAFISIAKKFTEGLSIGGKKPVISGGLTSLGVSAVAWLSTYITDHLFTVFWFLAAIFLMFGLVHILYFQKKYFTSNPVNKEKALIGELLFCFSLIFFMIVIFSALQYFIKGEKSFLFYPMLMSGIAFFIPMLVKSTFEAAYKIPAPVFSIWQYPVDHTIELPPEVPNEKILVIAFEILKKKEDAVKTNFRAKTPDTMTLGDLYYHFINDYNEFQSETTIEFMENKKIPEKWWFRLKKKWYEFEMILDPDLTIRDNNIKENSIIICERIN